jgi:hypothetical protein
VGDEAAAVRGVQVSIERRRENWVMVCVWVFAVEGDVRPALLQGVLSVDLSELWQHQSKRTHSKEKDRGSCPSPSSREVSNSASYSKLEQVHLGTPHR